MTYNQGRLRVLPEFLSYLIFTIIFHQIFLLKPFFHGRMTKLERSEAQQQFLPVFYDFQGCVVNGNRRKRCLKTLKLCQNMK